MRVTTRSALAVAFCALSCTVALAVWGSRAAGTAQRWIEHTHAVIDRLSSLQRQLASEQAAYGSLLLTQDSTIRATYLASERDAGRALDELQQLTEDNPAQRSRLVAVRRDLLRLEALRDRARLERAKGREAAIAAYADPERTAAMASVDRSLREFAADERSLLAIREARQRRASRALGAAVVGSVVIAAAVVVLALVLMRREAATLARSEERFRALARGNPDGIIVQSGDRVRFANDAAAAMFGERTAERLIGGDLFELVHPDDRPLTREKVQRVLHGGVTLPPMVIRFRGSEGREFEAEVHAASIDFEGMPSTEVALRDVTERRAAERALRASEERYRLLADNSVDLISRSGVDGRLEYASPSFTTVLGWTPGELAGTPLAHLTHPDDVQRLRDAFEECVVRAAPVTFELRKRRRTGEYVWMEGVAKPMRGPDVAAVGALIAERDVTERRSLQEQLRQSQKLEAMGRMAGGVAHDFNNLLMVVRGSTDLLRKDGDDAEARGELLADISGAVDRASALTAQLLAFSRRQHSAPAQLEVPVVLRQLLPLLQRLAGAEVVVRLSIGAAAAAGATVRADPVQVDQVVLNLTVNARDAMPTGGTMQVHVDAVRLAEPIAMRYGTVPTGDYVTLSVEDSGIGMGEPVMQHLFEPFYTTKPQGEGTGLGLSTVFGIVQQAHGAITVSSRVGAGSTFTVYWPRVTRRLDDMWSATTTSPAGASEFFGAIAASTSELAPTAADAPATPEAATPSIAGIPTPPSASAPSLVVVVDDEEALRRVITRILESSGYRVLTAQSGREALEVVHREREFVRAVVTDVRMPEMSGVELVGKLMHAGIDIPVVFISGQLDFPIPTDWPATVPRAFLGKPFAAADLAHVLANALQPT